MECTENEWQEEGMKHIEMYIDRGGRDQGNIPQLLSGAQLLNTIGFALKVQWCNPDDWSENEKVLAETGNLCYYKDNSLKAIQVVVDQILKVYNHSSLSITSNCYYITVLPIELYHDKKLYSLSIIRFRLKPEEKWKFVDNVGRVYSSFEDWEKNNVLPPGQVLYPYDGQLGRHDDGNIKIKVTDTPSCSIVHKLDIASGLVGLTGAIGAMVVSGGLAIPFIAAGVGSALYGSGRTISNLVDKKTHAQSISPVESFSNAGLWLGLAANCISFGAMGATWRLTSLALKGELISENFKLLVNVTNGTCLTVNSLAEINSLCQMVSDWDSMTAQDVLFQVISIGFFAKAAMSYRPAKKMIRTIHDNALNSYSKKLKPEELSQFNKMRKKYRFDRTLVKHFHESTSTSGVMTESMKSSKKLSLDTTSGTITFKGTELKFSTADLNTKSIVTTQEIDKFSKMLKKDILKPVHIAPNSRGLITMGNGNMFSLEQLMLINTIPNVFKYVNEKILPLNNEDAVLLNEIREKFDCFGYFLLWIIEMTEYDRDNTITTLLKLFKENNNIFSLLKDVIKNDEYNRGVINLNDQINISIFFLETIDTETRKQLIYSLENTEIPSDRYLHINNHTFYSKNCIKNIFLWMRSNKCFANNTLALENTENTNDPGLEDVFRLKIFVDSRPFNMETKNKLEDIVEFLQPNDIDDFVNCVEFVYNFYHNMIYTFETPEIRELFENQTSIRNFRDFIGNLLFNFTSKTINFIKYL